MFVLSLLRYVKSKLSETFRIFLLGVFLSYIAVFFHVFPIEFYSIWFHFLLCDFIIKFIFLIKYFLAIIFLSLCVFRGKLIWENIAEMNCQKCYSTVFYVRGGSLWLFAGKCDFFKSLRPVGDSEISLQINI